MRWTSMPYLRRPGIGLLLAPLLLLTGCLAWPWLLPGPPVPVALTSPAAPPAAEDAASIPRLVRKQRAALAGAIILDAASVAAFGAGIVGAVQIGSDRMACDTFCQLGISSLIGVGVALPMGLALALHRIEADLRHRVAAAGVNRGASPAAAGRLPR